jgi:hypothetical protein
VTPLAIAKGRKAALPRCTGGQRSAALRPRIRAARPEAILAWAREALAASLLVGRGLDGLDLGRSCAPVWFGWCAVGAEEVFECGGDQFVGLLAGGFAL